ncbi:WecB/TagA/CpsF family glycosyltransferase [Hyalangium sp.]|uniref:WecB/TagA/CpsF family glycosyltransferase n=1 Tax=Hyalangium sp. TaxID=2028555 RepID=UPI002D2574A3|nr:WecB/TagA/CpsF family glycosyltransferase [Hyalangium sp.]HYH95278.1 WecB/TagA/CpsF family glycosyltransferase [Hyalangium sp.]
MTATPDRTLALRASEFFELHQRIHLVDDEPSHDALLEELQHPSRPYIVSFVNAHAANLGWNTPAMLESLLRSDLLLRDGIGVKLGLKAFGRPPGLNMNGTDFIPKIARAYKGRRAALFGTRSPWLDTARQRLEAEGLVVVSCHDGFSSPETYLELAAETKPELIILAMGMPKQEDIAVRMRERLSHPVLIVNGGAILDFLGGKVTRAPEVMRSTGLEWVYRLYLEPKRLARRYLLGIPIFFSHVAVTRLVGPQAPEGGERSP